MVKPDLQQLTIDSTKKVNQWYENHPIDKFEAVPDSKNWSAGQHLLHLIKLYKTINQALSVPKMVLRFKFGKRKHEEKSFEFLNNDFVKNYTDKKFEAPDSVVPGHVKLSDRQALLEKLNREMKLINKNVGKLSEKALSKYVIPHPYLGNMTLREFVMFNTLHNEHHLNTLNNYYL